MFGFWQKKTFVKSVCAYSTESKTGKVSGWSHVNLYENKKTGKREWQLFGRWTNSPAALEVQASVHAWCFGGPVPDGMTYTRDETPPKPRKDIPSRKTRPKLKNASGNFLPFTEEKAA